ncbi:hypothetical protein OH807_23280 [Kitasatospora sp. NBC_01560]|uniref:hypothetical protein n=1 Tax=Kitasatospora sp. NBC_01560 TaxID=2975965 RepID=UPI00386755CC
MVSEHPNGPGGPPPSDRSWFVLVERDWREHGGTDHRWQLTAPKEAPLGRDQALAMAEEAARTYLPGDSGQPSGRPGRRIFRLPDGGFLVELRDSGWRRHFRVSVGELVHTEEPEQPAARPEPAPARGRGLFGRR